MKIEKNEQNKNLGDHEKKIISGPTTRYLHYCLWKALIVLVLGIGVTALFATSVSASFTCYFFLGLLSFVVIPAVLRNLFALGLQT